MSGLSERDVEPSLGHPVFQHPDGTTCIFVYGDWFVPLDAGGEGYTCEKDHPIAERVRIAIRDEARAEVMAPSQAGAAWLRRLVRWWDNLGTVDLYDDDVWKQR